MPTSGRSAPRGISGECRAAKGSGPKNNPGEQAAAPRGGRAPAQAEGQGAGCAPCGSRCPQHHVLCLIFPPRSLSRGAVGCPHPRGLFLGAAPCPIVPFPFQDPLPWADVPVAVQDPAPLTPCPPQHSPNWHGVSHPASSTAHAPWQHPTFPCQGATGPPPALLPAAWAREEGGNTVQKNQTLPVALLPRGWAAQTAALRDAATSERAEGLKKIHGWQFGSHLCLAWDVQG